MVDADAALDDLDRRLTKQSGQLADLRTEVARILPVYEAAKRYVLSPFVDGTESKLAADLEHAVHEAVAAEPVRPRPMPTSIPSAGRKERR